MATHLEQSADLEIGSEANDGGGEGSGAETASPAPAKAAPVRDVLSKTALALLAPKARSKPLSAQTDGFVLSTIGRVVDAHRDGEVSSAIAGADLRELLDEADRRALTKQLSAGTCAEAERIASTDDDAAPIAVSVEVPAHVQAAFDDAADIMSRAFPAEAETAPEPAIDFATDLPGTPTVVDRVVDLFVDDIAPDPEQPRLDVDEDLADSIAAEGVKQPIVVRVHPNAHDFALVSGGKDTGKATTQVGYIIVDGERRWRASVKAGRKTIPARVTTEAEDAGDRLLLQVTLNEGKRLAPMEEAKAWKRIMDAKSWNIQQLASALGRAKSTVSDRLALLDAPKPFQELFMKGQLSAAAAPIVREYREVPESTLKEVVKSLVEDEYEGWGKFIANGVPVPVDVVKELLENELLEPWGNNWLVRIDKQLADKYEGPVATIKGTKYATDAAAYRAIEQQRTPATTDSVGAPTKRAPSDWELKERARQRKEREAREKMLKLRRAQFDAINTKLPTSIDGAWGQFLVEGIVKEMTQDTLRAAVQVLAITPPKKSRYGGYEFDKAIIGHAAMLPNGGARVKLALQLLLMFDVMPYSYSTTPAERFTAAAKILKLDLSKVKAPDSAEKKPAAKKAAKKGGRR